jgi:Cu2+-exporting ATPase
MAEKKEAPESPKMGMEHKMHGMAEGQEMNEPGEEPKMHEMGSRPNAPHKTHRGRHEGHVTEDFKRRFIISLILTLPILVLSPFIQDLLRFKLEFPGSIYALFLLSTFVYFYGGYPFLKGFLNEIRENK